MNRLRIAYYWWYGAFFCILDIIPTELLCNMKFRILMYNLIAPEEAEILYTVA